MIIDTKADMIKGWAKSIWEKKERIILDAVGDILGRKIDSLEGLLDRCGYSTYDGREIFFFDKEAVVAFQPLKTEVNGQFIGGAQEYTIL